MKRILALALTLALLVSAAACTKQPTNEPEQLVITHPTLTLQDELNKVPEATHYDWADDLPRMDGSTSTIPLEAGIRAALFGTSIAEAELQVAHSTTYGSFYNLINGECDLIFSVPLSEKQITEAKDKGMELEMAKIAAEGFVFVVNAKNPVDTLTQQQLRDIYSGKITNWSEVGGNDAPIIAYQRNETSGSQNFMSVFMGDTPLMNPLTSATYTPAGMGELMDAVAYYDNAENALGYSVYAYAADMYGNGDEIKFIHVDGVEPTKATMSDGSYPLLSFNYAVYDKATPVDSNLRKLVEWIGTDEGQRAVKAAGYIPLRNVGDVVETVVQLYSAVGTGKEKPADHTPSLNQYAVLYDTLVQDTDRIDGLTNDELETEINTFISETIEKLKVQTDAVEPSVNTECINGYLSVCVAVTEKNGDRVDARTAIYDLVAAKRIAFSDLFYKGEEYIAAINADITEQLREQVYRWDENGEMYVVDLYPTKRAFAGIEAGHDTFTLTSVVFPKNNLYFDTCEELTFHGSYSSMVLSEARDMSGLFDDRITVQQQFAQEAAFTTMEKLVFGEKAAHLLDPAQYDADVCDKINAALRGYCASEFSKEEIEDAFYRAFGKQGHVFVEAGSVDLNVWADRYLSASGSTIAGATENTMDNEDWGEFMGVMYSTQHFFDLKTGEEVSHTAFLKDGWQEAGDWKAYPFVDSSAANEGTVIDLPDLTDAILAGFWFAEDGVNVTFRYPDILKDWVQVKIPLAYINWEA